MHGVGRLALTEYFLFDELDYEKKTRDLPFRAINSHLWICCSSYKKLSESLKKFLNDECSVFREVLKLKNPDMEYSEIFRMGFVISALELRYGDYEFREHPSDKEMAELAYKNANAFCNRYDASDTPIDLLISRFESNFEMDCVFDNILSKYWRNQSQDLKYLFFINCGRCIERYLAARDQYKKYDFDFESSKSLLFKVNVKGRSNLFGTAENLWLIDHADYDSAYGSRAKLRFLLKLYSSLEDKNIKLSNLAMKDEEWIVDIRR